MGVVKDISTDELTLKHASEQALAIADSATLASEADQFVFFAAFDGTNNDKDDVALSGNPQDTNVAQLFVQAVQAERVDSRLKARYYPGPGTRASRTASSWFGPEVTAQAVDTAERAYEDFGAEASKWLQDHPQGSATAMMTSFSRGGASAAIFSQLLWERGLVDPHNGKVLIPPGKVGVSAGLIYDPVDTGVSGNLAFAPNVQNITVVHALDERRTMFRGADYIGQPGVRTLDVTGNHCDIGGGYDNGLGALTLQAGTEFFRRSGMSIADVAEARRFDPTKPVVIHTEGVDERGHEVWTEDAKFGYGIQRQKEHVVTAPMKREAGPNGDTTHFTDFRGANIELTVDRTGAYIERTRTQSGTVVKSFGPIGATAAERPKDVSRSGASSDVIGDFNVYGLDGKGNIHPSLRSGTASANERYIEEWCNDNGKHYRTSLPRQATM